MIKGFEPIVYNEPRVLILGSLPSVKSLEKDEYYGNPNNRFWKVLGIIFEMPINNYDEKKEILKKQGIALWDVCYAAKREGSLDLAIHDEIPNDLEGLINNNPSIQKICCTGGLAYKLCLKYFSDLNIEILKLSSPSPANAKMKLEDLVLEYEEALR